MKPEDFESQLRQQPMRVLPVAWRDEVLSAAKSSVSIPLTSRPAHFSPSNLRERLAALLWPCPQAWAGLAVVWLIVLTVDFSQGPVSREMARQTPSSAEAALVFRARLTEQQHMLAQLIEPYDQVAEPPKSFVPRPRSEFSNIITV